jgi:hypothetical protein
MSDPEELEFEANYEKATDELEALRRIANEVWAHAATIDGLMRYLGPLLDDVEQRGYERGLTEVGSGVVAYARKLRGEPDNMTLDDAKRFFELSEARAHPRCWRVRKEYLNR